jgi:hypothetical protein
MRLFIWTLVWEADMEFMVHIWSFPEIAKPKVTKSLHRIQLKQSGYFQGISQTSLNYSEQLAQRQEERKWHPAL